MVSKSSFESITGLVIDNLEGGYYHPDMLNDNRGKNWSSATKAIYTGSAAGFSPSGETMFGLDRLNGAQESTPEGRLFWKTIDEAGARGNWSYNYKGGALGAKLKKLAADIQYSNFISWSSGGNLSVESHKAIEKDPRLIFHFAYATWNGPVFFKRFAKDINEAVASGVKSSDELVQIALNSRRKQTASTIKQSADKLQFIFLQPAFLLLSLTSSDQKKILRIVLLVVVVVGISVLAFYLIKHL